MTCHGIVKDGAIVLPPGVTPPEGAEVTITVVSKKPASSDDRPAELGTLKNGEPVFRGERNGVPQLNVPDDAEVVTLEFVNRLRDEDP